MSDMATDDPTWTPWRVVPDSGFEVANQSGGVGIDQIDERRFLVQNTFRFSDELVERELVDELVARGREEADARAAVVDARTYVPSEDEPTDLASIPKFMRWFADPYGRYSLAALIHDRLITDEANGGRLGSDTLSDEFFRMMMAASGVPWLKRWIMWSAVALRSRIAAGGLRRWSAIAWLTLSAFGIACSVDALGGWLFDWATPFDPWWLLAIAVVLPFVAAPLWGEQWGASLVFAITGFWLVPAAAIAGAGYVVYLVLEYLAGKAGYT